MAATPMLPPGGLLEIVLSFDTTGSMSSMIEEVQGSLQDMIQRLQDIPGIRIGAEFRGRYGPCGINRDMEGLLPQNVIPTRPKVNPTRPKVNPKRGNVTVKNTQDKLKCNADAEMVPREKTPQTVFTCNCLDWSSWRLTYTPVDVNEPNTRRGFRRTFRGKCHTCVQPFSDRCKSALYEVAVQTKARGKRHVMFSKVISGTFDNREWEYNLLFGATLRLRRQIKSVVEQGCKVFVRRATLNEKDLPVVDSLNKYSYAWNLQKDTRQHRRVVRDSVVISGECVEE